MLWLMDTGPVMEDPILDKMEHRTDRLPTSAVSIRPLVEASIIESWQLVIKHASLVVARLAKMALVVHPSTGVVMRTSMDAAIMDSEDDCMFKLLAMVCCEARMTLLVPLLMALCAKFKY